MDLGETGKFINLVTVVTESEGGDVIKIEDKSTTATIAGEGLPSGLSVTISSAPTTMEDLEASMKDFSIAGTSFLLAPNNAGVVDGGIITLGQSSSTADTRKEDLEGLTKQLTRNDADADVKSKLLSKLEGKRLGSAEEKRLARKAAWIESARKEVRQRIEFREKQPANVFPELVWKSILENLDDPKDKAQLSRMSLMWRDLLKNDRATFLFHAVFPLLHPLQTRDDMLNSRSVCREWKRSLESYLQNLLIYGRKPHLIGMEEEEEVDSFAGRDYLAVNLRGDHHLVAEFLQKSIQACGFGSSNPNPLISRKVFLEFPGHHHQDDDACAVTDLLWFRYWDEVFDFVLHWGRQIWELHISIRFNKNSNSGYACNVLRVLLNMMPNLRFLSIDGGTYNKFSECRIRPSNNYYRALREQMEENPLPVLPHLINFSCCGEVPSPIITGILNKCSSSLENAAVVEFFGSPSLCAGNSSFPQLKSLTHCATHQSLVGSKFAADLPGLEMLSIIYLNLEATDVPKLFLCVSEFGRTLRDLTLCLRKVSGPMTRLSEMALKMLSLELPHLEELKVCVSRINLKNLDFILPLKSLKTLNICYVKHVSSSANLKKKKSAKLEKPDPSSSGADDVASEEIIQFGNYTSRLYESNIWKLLPELGKVTIRVMKLWKEKKNSTSSDKGAHVGTVNRKDYTREDYHNYCSSSN